MDILILGGTRFIGRHIVEAALEAGHRVTILTRGRSPDELPADVERVRGDRDLGAAGLAALGDRTWDACVDVSGYTPAQVRGSVERLRGRAGRYAYVSTRAVYDEPCPLPITEDAPLRAPAAETVTEVDGDTYGPLKVACERIVRSAYGDACTVLRPQIVVGPFERDPRYAYWVERAARGGVMAAPGDGSDHLQVVDARDLARFAVKVVQDGIPGTFNVAGARLTWAEFLRACGAERVRWVEAETLRRQVGDARELSLYVPDRDPHAGRMNVDNTRAVAAGLEVTDPAVTARDTLAWSRRAELPFTITPELEAEVLRRAEG